MGVAPTVTGSKFPPVPLNGPIQPDEGLAHLEASFEMLGTDAQPEPSARSQRSNPSAPPTPPVCMRSQGGANRQGPEAKKNPRRAVLGFIRVLQPFGCHHGKLVKVRTTSVLSTMHEWNPEASEKLRFLKEKEGCFSDCPN